MGYIGAKLKDGPGMTTCKTCQRALFKKDADKDGNCPDHGPEGAAPIAVPETAFTVVPAERIMGLRA